MNTQRKPSTSTWTTSLVDFRSGIARLSEATKAKYEDLNCDFIDWYELFASPKSY